MHVLSGLTLKKLKETGELALRKSEQKSVDDLKLFSALVIEMKQEDKDIGDLLQIACVEAMKRHHLKHGRIEVKEIIFVPRLKVYVALYKRPDVGARKDVGQ